MVDSDTNSPRVSQEEIKKAMTRVLDSGVIGERSRLRTLLEYIVQEEIEERGDRIKAFAIGIDVLGRGEDFDPNTDSIVRVEVNRLRGLLKDYYESVGSDDRVIIEIPRGTYRPTFRTDPVAVADEPEPEASFDPKKAAIPFALGTAFGLVLGLGLCAIF